MDLEEASSHDSYTTDKRKTMNIFRKNSPFVELAHRVLYASYQSSYRREQREGRFFYKMFASSLKARARFEKSWGRTLEDYFLDNAGSFARSVLEGRIPATPGRGIVGLLAALCFGIVCSLQTFLFYLFGLHELRRFIGKPVYMAVTMGIVIALVIGLERLLYNEEACLQSFRRFGQEPESKQRWWRWYSRAIGLAIIVFAMGAAILLIFVRNPR